MAEYKRTPLTVEEQIARTQLPRKGELFAIVEQRLGFNKMYVRCLDNKMRIGRVPGKYSRRLWVREGDLVLARLWTVESDKKCDVIFRYSQAQWDWLVRTKHIPDNFR